MVCMLRMTVAVGLLVAAGSAVAADGDGGGASGPLPVHSFARIEVGMGEQQVLALLGPPGAEGEYTPVLGRALALIGIGGPRRTYFYRGLGRVLFEGGNPLLRNGTVVRVEVDPAEPGTTR
jgi:hypothetical protein